MRSNLASALVSVLCLSAGAQAEVAKCVKYTTVTSLTSSTTTKTLYNTLTTTVTWRFSTARIFTKKTLSTTYTTDTDYYYTASSTYTIKSTATVGHTKVVPKTCPAPVCTSYTTRATTITKAYPTTKTLLLVKAKTVTKTTSPTAGVVTRTTTSGGKTVTIKSTVTQSTSTRTIYTDTAYRAHTTVYQGTVDTITATLIATASKPTATITATVFGLQVVDTDFAIDGYTIGLTEPYYHFAQPYGRDAIVQNGTKVWQFYIDPSTSGIFELSTGLRMYRDDDTCDGCYTEPVYFLADGVPEFDEGVTIHALEGCSAKCGELVTCQSDGFSEYSFGIEDYSLGAQIYSPGDRGLNLKAVHPGDSR